MSLPAATLPIWIEFGGPAMPIYEYSKWDGSQQFLPQSADKVFDQLSEFILQHGDRVLRNMDDLEDEMPEIVELIQKEGLIEKDEDGQWRVTPRGVRRIQDRSLDDLFQTFRRDSLGRHDTHEKGEGTVPLEDTRPYVYGDSLANLDLHETIKNAYIRQGGGVPIRLSVGRLRGPRDRVPDPVCDGRLDRHERLDESVRQVLHDQEGRAGAPGDGAGSLPARLIADDRLLHLRQSAERAAARELGAQAGEHVRQPDQPAFRPRQAGGPRAPALHQYPRRPAAGAERAHAAAGERTSRSS